jgi:hypothetical protein
MHKGSGEGSESRASTRLTALSLLGSAYDHIDLTAAALGTDQPLSPIGHGRFGAVSLGHLGRVGLNLVTAILAPNDQPDAGGGSIAKGRRWAGLGFHPEAAPNKLPTDFSARAWKFFLQLS